MSRIRQGLIGSSLDPSRGLLFRFVGVEAATKKSWTVRFPRDVSSKGFRGERLALGRLTGESMEMFSSHILRGSGDEDISSGVSPLMKDSSSAAILATLSDATRAPLLE